MSLKSGIRILGQKQITLGSWPLFNDNEDYVTNACAIGFSLDDMIVKTYLDESCIQDTVYEPGSIGMNSMTMSREEFDMMSLVCHPSENTCDTYTRGGHTLLVLSGFYDYNT